MLERPKIGQKLRIKFYYTKLSRYWFNRVSSGRGAHKVHIVNNSQSLKSSCMLSKLQNLEHVRYLLLPLMAIKANLYRQFCLSYCCYLSKEPVNGWTRFDWT